jgi:hypothetical protein
MLGSAIVRGRGTRLVIHVVLEMLQALWESRIIDKSYTGRWQ